VDAASTDVALVDLSSPAVQLPSIDTPYHPAVHAAASPAEEPTPQRVNGHAPSFDDERRRLETEIAVARERAVAATERTRQREADARSAMRSEVEATQRLIVELEERHREALALIAETAELEIARLRAEHEAALGTVPGQADGGPAHG
jgi:hypothetical protein